MSHETTCCIVGGGPAGVVLALLLTRSGVSVTLLEAHLDFEREFRGDTLHPPVLELMEQLGLAERLLELPHSRMTSITMQVLGSEQPLVKVEFGRLKTKFPFIGMMPQSRFLDFLTTEARKSPLFHLKMGATVTALIEEQGMIRGVRYRDENGATGEVRAALTVGADGRFSKVRKLCGFEPQRTAPPQDLLWFHLPRRSDDPSQTTARIGRGHLVVMLDRDDVWQVGYVIAKGGYQLIKERGLQALRADLADMVPFLADRVEHLQDWKQVFTLSVESSRVAQWYRPGVLLIGDAAHAMSPIGAAGINYAIQDAIVAANVLRRPLLAGQVSVRELREVQRQRELPTRVIQFLQGQIHRRVLRSALAGKIYRVPFMARVIRHIPWFRDLPARFMAFGLKRPRWQGAEA